MIRMRRMDFRRICITTYSLRDEGKQDIGTCIIHAEKLYRRQELIQGKQQTSLMPLASGFIIFKILGIPSCIYGSSQISSES